MSDVKTEPEVKAEPEAEAMATEAAEVKEEVKEEPVAEEAAAVEAADAAEDGGAAEGEEEGGGDDAGEPSSKKQRTESGPVKLGFKTFTSAGAAHEYFKNLLQTAPHYTDFNEYEYLVLLDLIKKGHPTWEKKIGGGLRSFQVRPFRQGEADAKAFNAIRKDGTAEDFSYIKCLNTLFPGDITARHREGGGGGGGGGGRGRGGRGGFSPRGGGGSPRGGRGGRGRGGRGRGWGRY
ncbi:hypothetical protein HYH03_012023 [Edaphochlamys debaryana]|uniref:Uncharacterized protein n=1 Tax=Edaphochlamys debaryana TaxID=47281 RepID=A0A835XZ59_9CHLO|nr:hypothetical protein HYH03_012023 [Edaphochlamys debaryana]|eukprot:KAG2489575.1 hypothetical protein HYH03_012023 [Edaphochlamys debaryana]